MNRTWDAFKDKHCLCPHTKYKILENFSQHLPFTAFKTTANRMKLHTPFFTFIFKIFFLIYLFTQLLNDNNNDERPLWKRKIFVRNFSSLFSLLLIYLTFITFFCKGRNIFFHFCYFFTFHFFFMMFVGFSVLLYMK